MMKIKIKVLMRLNIHNYMPNKYLKYLPSRNIQIATLGIRKVLDWHRLMDTKYHHINKDTPM